jgi:DNA polymerase-3 subunit delta'
MVGSGGALPLPWLEPELRRALGTRGHALLLHGPQGVGQFELALTIAQAWLCEATDAGSRPCGRCASCRLVQAHTHPDLMVLIPEAQQEGLGWGGDGNDADREARAKPSKEIKVDAVRALVAFAQASSGRGRGKVALMHPAERMNGIAANAFLKTLEEPAGATRFVLSCAAPETLPATIRSRCQAVSMALPDTAVAVAWLAARGVVDAATLLAATGGQPLDVLAWAQHGIDAELWKRLPKLVEDGVAAPLAPWPLGLVVDALQKVGHDAMCRAVGATPRYFPAAPAFGAHARLGALVQWTRELVRIARHVEHPWSAGLTVETLVQQGRAALRPEVLQGRRTASDSVHSQA